MGYTDRFRRHITWRSHENAPEYVCMSCNAGFDERWQVCPECGGYSIRRREWGHIQ